MDTKVDASRGKQSRLFCLGQIVSTPGALDVLLECNQPPSEFLTRHAQGDWGDLCEEDKEANEEALLEGLRLLSSYRTNNGTKIWIITEDNRSATTVLLPQEY